MKKQQTKVLAQRMAQNIQEILALKSGQQAQEGSQNLQWDKQRECIMSNLDDKTKVFCSTNYESLLKNR